MKKHLLLLSVALVLSTCYQFDSAKEPTYPVILPPP